MILKNDYVDTLVSEDPENFIYARELELKYISEEEIYSEKKLIIQGLERCLGIAFFGKIHNGFISGMAAAHIPPITQPKAVSELFKDFMLNFFPVDFEVSYILFAGGKINNENNRKLYEDHQKYWIEPVIKEFSSAKTGKFVPLENTLKMDLILSKDFFRCIRTDLMNEKEIQRKIWSFDMKTLF